MDHISSLLPKVLHKRGIKGQVDASFVIHITANWLFDRLPTYFEQGDLRVKSCKDNVVNIEVNHSIVAQECQALTSELLAYLQQETPNMAIEQVRITRA